MSELGSPASDAEFPIELFEDLLDYEPVEFAPRVTAPTLLVGVENDAVTPTEQIHEIHDQLAGIRQLLLFRDVTHYAAYEEQLMSFMSATVAWFKKHFARIRPNDNTSCDLTSQTT